MEIWKDIEEDSRFQISNLLSIRRKDFTSRNRHGKYLKKGGVKKNTIGGRGYYVCNIAGKTRLVHRLFAIAFIPNPNRYKIINHKNGIKTDNRIENLEWCTSSFNNQHAFDNGLNKPYWLGKKGNQHHSSKSVICMNLDNTVIKEYGSASEAARKTGFKQSNISKCARGEINQYKCYKWKYKNTL